mmetsp:Transcript_35712/g.83041  ORF Transcript_35712/g.83041 Transcript_35712/m.83041 type:complete len:495 (-) Transcript_35712:191-1675(-)|eukprot:CAMPEP_0113313542 /NCGR_PEP_ID=MMETSP0010_2-20120614/9923_1 /TAXON_ID=216773 ORGANISM="Corethron hystrix, Strain 308" /NCGR_SAMPLE_ID=MMETSP0010_2 /ASSEMBLY_ACC=CAM_ASM_000155 /LENGTH=494 /DNA_ID=CAMNT_0000169573 /DNA_START=154 /DNA_END=1638 /DNA_ORIENTATION=+ /assembly_acc=CAM_ASM_000155
MSSETCVYGDDADIKSYADCVIGASTTSHNEDLDDMYILFMTALIFFMQAGFATLCAGSVRAKNVQNVLLKNFIDSCCAALGFYFLGYGFAFGDGSTFIGWKSGLAYQGIEVREYAKFFIQLGFAANADTIIAGTVAERCHLVAYISYAIYFTCFVYPIIARSVWNSEYGFLADVHGVGVHDFAGSGVVHMAGGATALVAATILGPRKGRFFDHEGKPFDIPVSLPPSSVPLQVMGTFILWVGWYGFNPGSTQRASDGGSSIGAYCAVTATLSAATGCITAMFLKYILAKRRNPKKECYDLNYAMNGALSGLVGITAGCAVFEPALSIVVGFISGIVYCSASSLIKKLKIDDVVDAIPVHFFSGIWGVLSVGLFSSGNRLEILNPDSPGPSGLFYGGGGVRLACQIYFILFIVGWVLLTMIPFFLLLKHAGILRIDDLKERVGTDLAYHGGAAYNLEKPDQAQIDALNQRRKNAKDKRHQVTFNEENGATLSPQ